MVVKGGGRILFKMEMIISKLISVIKKKIGKSEAEIQKLASIIFLNKPLENNTDDVIGFESFVDSIKLASDSKANIIGVIADYGSGKSSLTSIIEGDSKKFPKPIIINMWDSMIPETTKKIKNVESNSQKSDIVTSIAEESDCESNVNSLVKSLIYQIASGINAKFGKYVNRKLSKNSFHISIITKNNWSIFFVILAIVFWATYKTYSGIINAGNIVWFINITNWDKGLYKILILNALLVFAIIFAILGINNAIVSISDWKNQKEQKPELNDIFDVYSYVYNRLMAKKRRVIVIEDLDRIDHAERVLDFIREIYRLNNMPTISKFNNICRNQRPIFLISIKPEYKLNFENVELKSADEIYSKIFDYTINLKPIHYEDYADIVLKIIEQSGKMDQINIMLSIGDNDSVIENNKLPNSFEWLINGHNLTIRQLKDRLNDAFMLFVTLKNKGYKNEKNKKGYISFSSCSAVTYLEHSYPLFYSKMIESEEALSVLIDNVRDLRGGNDKVSYEEEIKNRVHEFCKQLQKNNEKISSISNDLNKMLLAGEISDDFRMYFYSFPRESYIKNNDERNIVNYLLYPQNVVYEKNQINQLMDRLEKDDKLAVVLDSLNRISDNLNTLCYPAVVLENKYLIEQAFEINLDKLLYLFKREIDWTKFDYSKKKLGELYSVYDTEEKFGKNIWTEYIKQQVIQYNSNPNLFGNFRKEIARVFGSAIKDFIPDLYYGVQIITEDELFEINDLDLGIEMIDIKQIDEDNFFYIFKYINCSKLSQNSYNRMKEMLYLVIANEFSIDIKLCMNFLRINKVIEKEILDYISSINDIETKELIGEYLNEVLDAPKFYEYYPIIEEKIIDRCLSNELIDKLIEADCLSSVLSFLSQVSELKKIDFFQEEIYSKIAGACRRLLFYYPESIVSIRKEIINQYHNSNLSYERFHKYNNLFFDEYPIITIQEIELIENIETIVQNLNRSKITELNYDEYITYINNNIGDVMFDKLFFVRCLFSDEYEDKYKSIAIQKSVFEKLDFSKIKFDALSDEDKNKIIDIFPLDLNVTDPTIGNEFMIKSKCLIPSLEEIVLDNIGKDAYIRLLEVVNDCTLFTIKWVMENDIEFPLNSKVLKILLHNKSYDKYFVGKVLSEKVAISFPYDNVPNETVIQNFKDSSHVWTYLKNNNELIEHIITNSLFHKFDLASQNKQTYESLYIGKQTFELVEFIFEKITTTNDEKISYLNQIEKIKTALDSIKISKYMVLFIELFRDDDVFEHFKFVLWGDDEDDKKMYQGHKSAFTSKRNQYIKNLNI